MSTLFDQRRYLSDFDSTRTGNIVTDVLVIGSGVAGARAAIESAEQAFVTLITKDRFDESSTAYAQGGIAAAIGIGDSPDVHLADTLRVGCGLNDRASVQRLVTDGPRAIEDLQRWGAEFDLTNETLALGREGGHSLNRIVHAKGDQTGQELVRILRLRVLQSPNIRVFEHCYFIDLLTLDGTCVGASTYHSKHGHQLIWAKQTILATGGAGQLWRETTNPSITTGDGLAAAFRAGARLRDLEFMQFHPTTLYVAGAGRSLISEAVRGEGALLVDRAGHRFMVDRHPDAELAPRDIVSRAIHDHLIQTRSNCVYLDVRHIPAFAVRFPKIAAFCAEFGIDVTKDLIPVRPSAHYLVGGIETALDGSTNVPGLLSCGEVSSTGVHGANRMASNSLLEGLVFGRLAGETAGRKAAASNHATTVRRVQHKNPPSTRTSLDLPDIASSLRSLMWRNVGIVRSGDRLKETLDILNFWAHYTLDKTFDTPAGWEVLNSLTAARLITLGALERTESIGTHYRVDSPPNALSMYHVTLERNPDGTKLDRANVSPRDT
ncbi:MAG: L-aspartate oxidase [Planctomycetota bacterium]